MPSTGVMPYGNAPPPEGAPVPPQELIGASIFLGLISVVSISRHGSYLITLGMGRAAFDVVSLAVIGLNTVGFAGSLWLLAMRRWAWALCLGYAAIEVGLHLYYAFADLVPGIIGKGSIQWLGGFGEAVLGLVFLVVLAFLSGPETRQQLDARDAYRRAESGAGT
jgi:hypothetical protein